MERIRTKDKLFLAIVGPCALAAAYIFLWRGDVTRRIEALAREESALVEPRDFPAEKQRGESLLKAAKGELAQEKNRPVAAVKVRANADDSLAARERAVLEVFRLAGVSVGRGENAMGANEAAGEVLRRTGLRPNPVSRRYSLAGSYAQVSAALRTFVAREMAVIPERIEMTNPGRWTLTLWL